MRKKVLLCCLLGGPVGVTICTFISILFSLRWGGGMYLAVPHGLVEQCGGELRAVILQTLCGLLYGAVWGGASVIWKLEHWSLLKMTGTHLALCSLATFPIAYFMQWMPHSLLGAACFFGLFFAIYGGIWFVQYSHIKKQIAKINRRLEGEQ